MSDLSFMKAHIFPKGVNVFGRLPFIVKLIIASFIDFVGITTWLIGLPMFGLGVPQMYAVLQAFIGAMLWNSWFLTILIGFSEAMPQMSALPSLTFIALWNGYKTGWRY